MLTKGWELNDVEFKLLIIIWLLVVNWVMVAGFHWLSDALHVSLCANLDLPMSSSSCLLCMWERTLVVEDCADGGREDDDDLDLPFWICQCLANLFVAVTDVWFGRQWQD